jgi:NAD(P)-dependent dehydrogenase (short-subunit alcohol dehydrogenase family)
MDPGLTRDSLGALLDSFVRDVELGQHERNGWPSSAYRVSKAGLNAYTRILARELADTRIRLNAVCAPGLGADRHGRGQRGAHTPVWAELLREDGPTGGFFRDRKTLEW